ncbi:MAG: hypothetical protein GY898_01390 [Proteobacteria bacterium]|nr:hypothetical protein [Pseudomonadota bacterium]
MTLTLSGASMTRSSVLILVLSLLVPAIASAGAAPNELVEGLDAADWLVEGTAATPNSQWGMFSVRPDLGVLQPYEGATFSLMTTGDPDSTACADYDWPGALDQGDFATLEFELDVPAGANTLRFYTYFLTREYPEWVGSEFNDVYTGRITPEAGSVGYEGDILFDAFGNPITVNSALFAVTGGPALAGTCFEKHGGTGWIQAAIPVVAETRITLTFEIWDVSDGIFDSWAILDGFDFDETDIEDPIVDPVPDEPLRIGFVSPKEGPLEGGGQATIHGFGFTPQTQVIWNGEVLTDVTMQNSGEALRIDSVPGHDATESIDIVVVREDESATLIGGYTYYDPTEGLPRPEIHAVEPGEAHPDGGTLLTVIGTGIWSAATAAFIDEDGNATDVDMGTVTGPAGGSQQVVVTAPQHPEGWVSLVLTNTTADDSVESVGYPILVTMDAVSGRIDLPRDGCSCSAGASKAAPGLLLLLVPFAMRRRR